MNITLDELQLKSGQGIEIVRGDITTEEVDAIVNAANEMLLHGGGVAGIIARKGGPQIQEESSAWVRQHGPVSHAQPAYTSGGRLPCRYVIHAVGPVWGSGDEDAKLASAVQGSLALADRLGLASIALPAISTGIFGFPVGRAAGVILGAVREYFARQPASGLKQVRLVLYDQTTADTFLKAFRDME